MSIYQRARFCEHLTSSCSDDIALEFSIEHQFGTVSLSIKPLQKHQMKGTKIYQVFALLLFWRVKKQWIAKKKKLCNIHTRAHVFKDLRFTIVRAPEEQISLFSMCMDSAANLGRTSNLTVS